jgi:rhodanese-related sulfurtransferase
MAKSYEELVAEAKAETEQTNVETVHAALSFGEDITIVDVREPDEFEVEHIPQAKLIPRGMLETQAAELLPDKDARIVTHCGAGGRGSLAAKSLKEMGYTL